MMNDAQIQNIIQFETQLSKIHAKRAREFTQHLKNRRTNRARLTAKKMTADILEKLSGETSKQ